MITIIDYGLGNISAFLNVYRRLNIPISIARTADDLKAATKFILPGVGTFDHAMSRLNNSGMREALERLVLVHRLPVIGICVGMQMLAKSSEEGILPGLGWIDGSVKQFNKLDTNNVSHLQLPHMGWNDVAPVKTNRLFNDLGLGSRFYFLHSYYFSCNQPEDVIALTNYGEQFTSAVNLSNIFGVQFHPEKSHQWGIQLLKNFAEM